MRFNIYKTLKFKISKLSIYFNVFSFKICCLGNNFFPSISIFDSFNSSLLFVNLISCANFSIISNILSSSFNNKSKFN